MKFTKLFIASALALTFMAKAANAQWVSPDEKDVSCAATPAELEAKPQTLARVNAIESKTGQVGLEALLGVWKYSSVFAKATVSVAYDDSGFFVQNGDDEPEQASICIDDKNADSFRVSIHSPYCPENKNFYVKAIKPGQIHVNLFLTRYMGGVKFEKKSDQPLPPGSAKAPAECSSEDEDYFYYFNDLIDIY